jgi:hypothetical protein
MEDLECQPPRVELVASYLDEHVSPGGESRTTAVLVLAPLHGRFRSSSRMDE